MEVITGPSASFVAQQQQSQPDLVGQYSRLLQLKNLQQQQALAPLQVQEAQQRVQANTLDIQSKQREADSAKAIMDAWSGANGDLGKTYEAAARSGKVLPGDLAKIQQANLQLQEQALKTLQAKGERAVQEGDLFDGAVDTVHAAKPEDRPAVYAQALTNLQKAGIDVSQAPPQYPGDDAFNAMRLGIKSHKNALDQAAKQAEIGKNTAQAAEANAGTAEKQAAAQFYQQNGGAPGVSAEMIQQADWLKKNPGKGPSDYKLWVMQHSPTAMVMGNQLSPDAINLAAQNLLQTGQGPQGMYRSPGTTAAVYNKAAQMNQEQGGPGLAANKATYQADAHSLAAIQKNFDNVTAFENTAGKNLDQFLKTAKEVVDSGSPLINSPLRSLSSQAIGSDKMAAFNAARQTALTEIAKVLSSANAGSGVVSDSARHEVESLIGPNASLKQIYAAANILKTDMDNRHQAYADQIGVIKQRMSNQQQPSGGIGIGAVIEQNGHRYKVTAVDKNGKPTAADPVQ